MLTALRRGASTTVAKVFLIIVSVAVVAGLGFGGFIGSIGQRTVLAVGDAEISAETFQIALQRQINQLSQQLGTNLTLEQARLFGIDRQLLGQLASEAALNSQAQALRLGVSDDRLADRIASDPIFLQTGGFNRQFFQQVLRSYGITEDEFVTDTRSFAARQQLALGLVGGMEASTTMLEVANTYANEQRTLAYLVIDEAALGERPEPTQEDLQAFYGERTGDYRAPEYRRITYMRLAEADVADPAAVGQADVQAAYEAERDALTRSGQRDITQLLFQDLAQAQSARERLAEGQSVAELQADTSLNFTLTQLGSVQRTAILDAAAGDAAFALEEAGPTGIIEGRFGNIIMLVNAIIADAVTPLEEVEDRLRQELANAAAREEIFTLYDAIEDARAAGETFEEVARRFELDLVTVEAVDSNGFGRDGEPVDLPATDSLIAQTFDSDVGLENDALELQDGGFLWFEVNGVEEAHDLSFEEARARVEADWRTEQFDTLLRQRAGELVGELERGRTLQTLAIAHDLPLARTAPFTRGEAPDELGGPATVAAFEGAAGHVGDVEGPPDEEGQTLTRLVFVVEDVTRPAFFAAAADVQELAGQLGPALEDSVLTQYVGALQASLGVRVNQELVTQLTGGTGGL